MLVEVGIGDVQDAQGRCHWETIAGVPSGRRMGFAGVAPPGSDSAENATKIALCGGLHGDDPRVLPARRTFSATPEETGF